MLTRASHVSIRLDACPIVRIAILEDEPAHAEVICRALREPGRECVVYEDGRHLLRELRRETFDAFVVDWHVPHVTGPEIVQWVRRHASTRTPILFVTSRDAEQDIVEGLESGADDYMVKPVRRAELVARFRALLRRAYPDASATENEFGAYRFALHQREVFLNGERIALKPKEYDLALYLFRNAGRLLSHDHLLSELWGVSEVDTRTLTTHMSQLRRKLDLRPHHGYRLAPVYGIGYRFERISEEPACE